MAQRVFFQSVHDLMPQIYAYSEPRFPDQLKIGLEGWGEAFPPPIHENTPEQLAYRNLLRNFVVGIVDRGSETPQVCYE